MATITDRKARSIKPGDRPFPSGIPGLALKPTATAGRGKWVLRYVSPVTGKRRDMGLGSFPDVSVADALTAGREARELIAAGVDPIMKREAAASIPTFEQAARKRWEQVKPGFRSDKYKRAWMARLELHAFPRLGGIRVDRLTANHFAEMLRGIWQQTPEIARKTKQICSDVMAMCWAEGHIAGNPLDVVDRLLPKQLRVERHFPAMPWQQVPAFWQDQLTREPLLGARAALAFLILTAARSGEVRGASWDEIDMGKALWTVPATRMKAHREHRVPLSGAAIDVLHKQPRDSAGGLVFPSLRGKLLSDMALTAILRKAEAPSDVQDHWATAHGFRSSFRNWTADCSFDEALAERALAHTITNKVQAAYERTDRLEARIAMMEQWAMHVTGAGGNVVPLRAGAK